MSDLNLYWAEEALGEPYAPQDYRWMKSTRRVGLMLGGATCALTTSVLLGSAVYLQVDSSPHVAISTYEIEVVAQVSPPMPPPPAVIPDAIPAVRAPRAESPIEARTSLKQSAPRHTAATGPVVAPTPAAAPAEVKIKDAPAPAPAKARPSADVAVGEKKPLAKAIEAPKSAPVQGKATPAAAVAPATPAAPAAKPEPDTRIGISKAADSKPTDIASGEKLGIREILPDGIVMPNGRKIKNGSALPNGEILIGTDAGKGMAETDRRVLVLTP